MLVNAFEIPPLLRGPLDGLRFVVKDVIDVAGFVTGFGNPVWHDAQLPTTVHADCVERLLNAGASCVGKTVLGEFGCGLEGVNQFYEMPENPLHAERVPGGSSSGSAAAVGFGLADFALGTDVGGSMRVPAAHCGLYGLRPSFDRVSLTGCRSLAPSLDTIGVFVRSADVLARVMRSLLVSDRRVDNDVGVRNLYVLDDLMQQSSLEIQHVTQQVINQVAEQYALKPQLITLNDIDGCDGAAVSACLKTIICAEMLASMQPWIKELKLKYEENTFVDFSAMDQFSDEQIQTAYQQRESLIKKVSALLLPEDLICFPTLPKLPRFRDDVMSSKGCDFNYDQLRPFIALSSLCGLPQLTLPGAHSMGVSFVGAQGADELLIGVTDNLD